MIVVIWLSIGVTLAEYLGGARRSALEKAATIVYEDEMKP